MRQIVIRLMLVLLGVVAVTAETWAATYTVKLKKPELGEFTLQDHTTDMTDEGEYKTFSCKTESELKLEWLNKTDVEEKSYLVTKLVKYGKDGTAEEVSECMLSIKDGNEFTWTPQESDITDGELVLGVEVVQSEADQKGCTWTLTRPNMNNPFTFKLTITGKEESNNWFGNGSDPWTNDLYYLEVKDQITELEIGNNIISICGEAFKGLSALESVTIPGDVKDLNHNCFDGCTSLKNVTFQEGSEGLMFYADVFASCTSLESITLPARTTMIAEGGIFDGCTNLKSGRVVIEEGGMYTVSQDGYGILKKYKDNEDKEVYELIEVLDAAEGEYVVESTIKKIASNAFSGSGVESVVLLGQVEYIGSGAFYKADKLKQVFIKNIANIEMNSKSLFYDGGQVPDGKEPVNLYVPRSQNFKDGFFWYQCGANIERCYAVESIKDEKGEDVSYKMPTMLAPGKTIVLSTENDNESDLVSVYASSNDSLVAKFFVKTGEPGSFEMNFRDDVRIEVQKEASGETVDGVTYWFSAGSVQTEPVLHLFAKGKIEKELQTINMIYQMNIMEGGVMKFLIEIEEGVTEIGKDVFKGLKSVQHVSIPKTLTEIAEGAFADCLSLRTFSVAEGNEVFEVSNVLDWYNDVLQKDGLLRTQWGDNGKRVFAVAGDISKYYVPAFTKRIAGGAFAGITALTEVVLREDVEEIGKGAFRVFPNSEFTLDAKSEKVAVAGDMFDFIEGNKGAKIKVFASKKAEWVSAYRDKEGVTIEEAYFKVYYEVDESIDNENNHETFVGPKEGADLTIFGDQVKEWQEVEAYYTYTGTEGKEVRENMTLEYDQDIESWTSSFTVPKKDVTIHAKLKDKLYAVTIDEAIENGTVLIDSKEHGDSTAFAYQRKVTLKVEPESDEYKLKSLTVVNLSEETEIEVTEGTFVMPMGEVEVTAEFELVTYDITVENDTELGTVECEERAAKGAEVTVEVTVVDTDYEVAEIRVGEETIENGGTFEMPGEAVTIVVGYRKKLVEAESEVDEETGDLKLTATNTAALTEALSAINDTKSDYYDEASIVLTSDIDGGEEQEIDLEEQSHESMREKAIDLPTIETLKGSIEGQGNVIKNVIAQMTGLVKTVEEEAEVNTLVMDSTTIYIDPTDEAWTVKDNTIYVHIVAKSNKGNINNFAFAGKVVVDESKVPEGMTVVVCIVGENEGTVNGFFYDFDLLEGNVEGNKRCITIKQNIGCAKNGGRSKVATSKAANNKTLNVGTYDEAEVNKMERAFTAREFASGEVAYWLNWSEQGYTGEYKPIWRQGKNYPELAIDVDGEMNALYKIEYVVNEPEKITDNPVFANNGDKVTIKYAEKPVSIKNGDEEVEVGDESTTIVFHANKSIEIEFAETTGKNGKNGKNGIVKEAEDTWHDMAGRKLTGKPGQKGVYVHNGKIEMVK